MTHPLMRLLTEDQFRHVLTAAACINEPERQDTFVADVQSDIASVVSRGRAPSDRDVFKAILFAFVRHQDRIPNKRMEAVQ